MAMIRRLLYSRPILSSAGPFSRNSCVRNNSFYATFCNPTPTEVPVFDVRCSHGLVQHHNSRKTNNNSFGYSKNRRFISSTTTSFNLPKSSLSQPEVVAGDQEQEGGRINSLVNKIFQRYEEIIGLTEVKHAQNRVIQAEKRFVETQESRRERQRQIQQLQIKLKEIHLELDKTSRGEDRYLHLITQEHSVIREEKTLLEDFRALEKDERDFFSALSLAVRESHERERAQAERTKYWSVIGSVCGAIIGIVGTTVNNRLRMKELRQLVLESGGHSAGGSGLGVGPGGQGLEFLKLHGQAQDTKIDSFLNELKQLLIGGVEVGSEGGSAQGLGNPQAQGGPGQEQTSVSAAGLALQSRLNRNKNASSSSTMDETSHSLLVNNLETLEQRLSKEMRDIKTILATQIALNNTETSIQSEIGDEEQLLLSSGAAGDAGGDAAGGARGTSFKNNNNNVSVYFGEDLSEIVRATERNLEWKMKINSLATVAAFYGMLAITVPILVQIFKGG